MSLIAAIEEAVLATVAQVLGSTVREKKSLGGGWTMEMLDKALQFAPGVYVAFLGGGPMAQPGAFDGKFMVYVVTKGALEPARRQGGLGTIGAYDILERLLSRLDGMLVPGIGSLVVTGIDNLFRDAMFDLGGTVYGIGLTMLNMSLLIDLDESSLDDFITFAADYDLPPFESAETHQQWVAEPPDYTSGTPDLQDTLQPQEE